MIAERLHIPVKRPPHARALLLGLKPDVMGSRIRDVMLFPASLAPLPKARKYFFSSRRWHTSWTGDWSSDVCSSDLGTLAADAHVFPGLQARLDGTSQHEAHGGIALVEVSRQKLQPRVPVQPQRELRHVVRADRESIEIDRKSVV